MAIAKKPKNNYINNPELHAQLVKHLEGIAKADAEGVQRPRCPDSIGLAIWLVAENLGKKLNFCNYTFLEEMKGDARENCIKYVHTYNPKYKNPHAWLTKITWQAFVRRIQREQKEQYIKYKLSSSDPSIAHTPEMHQHMSSIVEKFEKKSVKEPKKSGLEKFTEDESSPNN